MRGIQRNGMAGRSRFGRLGTSNEAWDMRPDMKTAILSALLLAPVGALNVNAGEWFAPFQRVADYRPKGPTHCFRQFNHDWSWIARHPDQVPEFLSEADPVALAELCRQTHVDGTVVMAVPHHGYCTHETRVGTKFPGMKGDWFGRTIQELHKRKIAAFGYVTLNWNWKFMRENAGKDFIHGKTDPYGVRQMICLNAPGYLELVEAYTREVLENYPVDGMRWDILVSAKQHGLHSSSDCTCDGCRRLFRELYGRELTRWEDFDERRHLEFYIATTTRAVERLHALCKRIKPSVEIWQNCLNSYHENDLNAGRLLDIAYNEFGDPFRLLLVRGATGKPAAINGLMNKDSPAPGQPLKPLDRREWRTCLALGGRCYSYYGHKQTNPKTLLPSDTMLAWHREQLAPFYKMVGEIEPWLQDAQTVSHIGIVFSERTRFQFPKYDRAPYVKMMEPIANAYLQRSTPVEFVNALDLDKPLSRFKLLIAPLTSGLNEAELEHLRRYVREGGNLLVGGDALPFPSSGKGKVVHLRDLDSPEIIDGLAGPAPVVVQPPESRVILTRQEKQRRWVLHLLDDGPCTIEIRREFAAAARVVSQYPASGWTCVAEPTGTGLRIQISGQATDRLLVLE